MDIEALLAFAREWQVVVRMERGIGEFGIDGTSLVSLAPQRTASKVADETAIKTRKKRRGT